ncbi:hypothetical protein [Brenneria alni]|uniref:hypothetical protein n=1 Tax=Brenneria alni TaxID=71656 RepID=UPI001F0CBEE8|nr:hypothetical protein [Brenneria alni]
MKNNKKHHQQSRSSGWGGKRTGAGAPVGNTNAVKHGEGSRRSFFALAGDNRQRTPLELLRVRNLLLAKRVGELMHSSLSFGTAEWREFMLLDGIFIVCYLSVCDGFTRIFRHTSPVYLKSMWRENMARHTSWYLTLWTGVLVRRLFLALRFVFYHKTLQ